jgi:hypothetical protein
VQTPCLFENLVDGGLYRFFFCHIGLQSKELVGIFG